jgi:hypothetical protein
MVVTYKESYSNSNDSDEFSWTWNVPDILNKIFPLCLKMLLHFKKRQVLLAHPVHHNVGSISGQFGGCRTVITTVSILICSVCSMTEHYVRTI